MYIHTYDSCALEQETLEVMTHAHAHSFVVSAFPQIELEIAFLGKYVKST
jgi:hypothetical protein